MQSSVAPADPDAFDALLRARYSCRSFQSRPVDRPVIERILEIAQRTPSWCNSQPWQVHVASGAATERLRQVLLAEAKSALKDPTPDYEFPREYLGVYQDRRRECGFQLYESVGVRRGDREGSARQAVENFRLFGAPHVLVVTTHEALGVYGVLDCGAWVNNFMLAARSLGVASIAQAALARRPLLLRGFFGFGEDRRVVCGISFGYEDTAHPANAFRTRRATIGDVAQWVDA